MAEHAVEFGKDGRPIEPDGRLDAAAFHRNHQPIWAVLERFLAGRSGDVLEAGSGTGQHVVHFARHAPDIVWWPSDLNEAHLKSIVAWRAHAGLKNIRPPLKVDLADPVWCQEMNDGSGPAETAGRVLRQCHPHRALARGGRPVRRRRRAICATTACCFSTARSSATAGIPPFPMPCSTPACAQNNPEWGVRDIGDVEALAARHGLALRETVEMPANNLILVFDRAQARTDASAWPAPAGAG